MRFSPIAAGLLAFTAAPALSQGSYDPAARMAAQREALGRLATIDGMWRGTAWSITPGGRHEVVHTERAGPFLGGSVRVIEGRAYNPDGSIGFNAFGTISYDPDTRRYTMQSHAMGRSGSFPLELRPDGYVWEAPAGPNAIVRYTGTISGGRWREIGERIVGDAPPVQVFEMNLSRVGDTDWPESDPVPPR